MVHIQLNNSLEWVSFEPIKEIKEIAKQKQIEGREIIDLAMINPDIPPPRYLIDKLMQYSLDPKYHKYSVAKGARVLREAISAYYKNNWGINLDSEENICVTSGAKGGVLYSLLSLLNKQENVLVGKPTYPAYNYVFNFCQLKPNYFEISFNWQKTLFNIEQALNRKECRLILLNFPNNPTGVVVPDEFWLGLTNIAVSRGIIVVNDFTYGKMVYNAKDFLASSSLRAGIENNFIEVFSMSKLFSIPGWRIGAVIGRSDAINRLAKLRAKLDYGLHLGMQYAAAATLLSGNLEENNIAEQYQQRVKLAFDILSDKNININYPNSGAFIWLKLPNDFDSYIFAKNLFEQLSIVVMPGVLFGKDYKSYIRIALVQPIDILAKKLIDIADFIEKI